jgi:hypothetical protein
MIEAASTGRSSCRKCKKPIAKGELRWGEEVPGNFDGMMTFWHHLPCAVARRPEQFRRELASYKGEVPDRATLEGSLDQATVGARLARFQKVDRAPTGRAKCQHCNQTIGKDSLRVSIVRIEEMPGLGSAFLHVGCANGFVGGEVGDQVIAKAGKRDKAEVAAILGTAKLLDSDPRGKELEVGVRQAKKPAAELSVLADWLEEQGVKPTEIELAQLLAARKKLAAKKSKRA